MTEFNGFGLPEALTHTLAAMEFTTPTPIQMQAIPVALEGQDILGSAQTGTGKTGAFGIPLVARLMNNPRGTAVVLTPTRELAVQVLAQLRLFMGKRTKMKTALLIGGKPMFRQLEDLKRSPRLIVGTPGRMNDHIQRGSLILDDADFLVMDETDRMLDMGFEEQIETIVARMPEARQTLLFSATMPKNIMSVAKKYLTDPVRITVGSTSTPAQNIKQDIIKITQGEKYDRLVDELASRDGSIIVFMNTKHGTQKMVTRLRKEGYKADALHGGLAQSKRDRVTRSFRKNDFRVLVATDVAARGLDIPHIAHVINYDVPQVAEDYIHRIGRTARAGKTGEAVCFVTPSEERGKWRDVVRLLDPDAVFEDDFKGGKSKGRQRRKPSGDRRRNNGRGRKPANDRAPRRDDDFEFAATEEKPKRRKPAGDKPKRRFKDNDRSGQKKDRRNRSDAPKKRERESFSEDKPMVIKAKAKKVYEKKPNPVNPETGKTAAQTNPGMKKSRFASSKPKSEQNSGDQPHKRKSNKKVKPNYKKKFAATGNKRGPAKNGKPGGVRRKDGRR